MNKHPLTTWIVGLLVIAFVLPAWADVQSLRGSESVESESDAPPLKPYYRDHETLERAYLQQPPLIPHKIDNYQINIKFNKCLSCHSWQNYRQHNAVKISQTHFESRDGVVMSNVSSRRYFCTQCHVPQTDAKPLVENTFQPVEALQAH